MSNLNPEFVRNSLESKPSNKAALNLIEAFQQDEAKRGCGGAFVTPYAYWQNNLDEGLKQRLLEYVDIVIEAVPDAQTYAACLGIQMRLYQRDWSLLSDVESAGGREDLVHWPSCLLLEATTILRAAVNWPALKKFTRQALLYFPRDHTDAGVITDCFVLAAYRLLGRAFNKGNDKAGAVQAFAADVDRATEYLGDDIKNSHFYRSLLAKCNGDYVASVNHVFAAQKAKGKVIILFQQLENFVDTETIGNKPSPELREKFEAVKLQFNHKANEDETTLLLSMDERYFTLFCGKYLESYGHWAPAGLVHLHCVNFSPSQEALDAIERSASCRINYTVDMQPAIIDSKNLYAGYCAGARYMYLPLYFKEYKNIVITDVDGLLVAPPGGLLQHAKNAIVLDTDLLKTGPPAHPGYSRTTGFLWEAIKAGTFAISRTDSNQTFATLVANYLQIQVRRCADHGHKMFYTDQIGLLLAYMALQDKCSFVGSDDIFRQQGDWSFAAKGDAKQAFQKAFNYKNNGAPRVDISQP